MMKLHNGRVDLKSQKEAISTALGENAAKYWGIFKDFVQAKLSKTEFDIAAVRVLGGGNNVKMHNQFVLSILKNARSPIPPPEFAKLAPLSGNKRKRPLDTVSEPPSKRRKTKSVVQESQTHSVVKRRSLSGVIRVQHILNNGESDLIPRMSKLDKQLAAEPELLILRQKMKSTAKDTSVSNVSNESVNFMMQAMQIHLKNTLALCLAEKKDEKSKISMKDLWKAVNNNPQIFNKTTSQTHERVLLKQAEPRIILQK